MIDKIISALKENQIARYQINVTDEESVELFFIKKRLDMRRAKKVSHCQVTVFHEFDKDGQRMLGSSAVAIESSLTQAEIEKKLKDAYFAASFVCNPYYELPKGGQEEMVCIESSLAGQTLADNAARMAEALFAEDCREDVFLNSAELFVMQTQVRILNSEGVDVGYVKHHVNGEFVAQCPSPQDVETYRNYAYDDLDTEALRAKVKEALELTKARANAVLAPRAGKYKVLLSGSYVRELLQFYLSRSSSAAIYPKYSTYSLGAQVQGEQVTGDRLNLTLKAKEPYSAEGVKMVDRPLLENGVLKTIHGGCRFAHYLGIEPTGSYGGFSMPAGTCSFEEMKKGEEPCLYVVNFSSFETNPFSGQFGGEIRLAFLIEGDKVTPVTGGSVNGSVLEVQSKFTFSSELQKEKGFEGPFAVCLPEVSVAGC